MPLVHHVPSGPLTCTTRMDSSCIRCSSGHGHESATHRACLHRRLACLSCFHVTDMSSTCPLSIGPWGEPSLKPVLPLRSVELDSRHVPLRRAQRVIVKKQVVGPMFGLESESTPHGRLFHHRTALLRNVHRSRPVARSLFGVLSHCLSRSRFTVQQNLGALASTQ